MGGADGDSVRGCGEAELDSQARPCITDVAASSWSTYIGRPSFLELTGTAELYSWYRHCPADVAATSSWGPGR